LIPKNKYCGVKTKSGEKDPNTIGESHEANDFRYWSTDVAFVEAMKKIGIMSERKRAKSKVPKSTRRLHTRH
jgi:hypothetical protein